MKQCPCAVLARCCDLVPPACRRIVGLLCDQPGLLRQFEGQHLSNLLWGLCRAGFRPPTPFLQAAARVSLHARF
jgi:hypothetical protein